jgi:hypothetical protein
VAIGVSPVAFQLLVMYCVSDTRVCQGVGGGCSY